MASPSPSYGRIRWVFSVAVSEAGAAPYPAVHLGLAQRRRAHVGAGPRVWRRYQLGER
jgi:hypothetical protein